MNNSRHIPPYLPLRESAHPGAKACDFYDGFPSFISSFGRLEARQVRLYFGKQTRIPRSALTELKSTVPMHPAKTDVSGTVA